MRLREITEALRFTGQTFRATEAIFSPKLAIIKLLTRRGSDTFKLYVAHAPRMRNLDLAQRALAAASGTGMPVLPPAVTLQVQPQTSELAPT